MPYTFFYSYNILYLRNFRIPFATGITVLFFLRIRYFIITFIFRYNFIISLNITETEMIKPLRKP